MPDTDVFIPRPNLASPNLLARAFHAFCQTAPSPAEIWNRLTQSFILDAVAALLPCSEPEPAWLKARA